MPTVPHKLTADLPTKKKKEDDDSNMYCMVGVSREPINAVIPLYLHPAHFQRVMLTHRYWLGYLFTLNPFGYEPNQEVALLTVLSKALQFFNGSEQQALLLKQVAQVCWGFASSLSGSSGKFNDVMPQSKLDDFINSCHGRERQTFPNLLVPLMWSGLIDLFHGEKNQKEENPKEEKQKEEKQKEEKEKETDKEEKQEEKEKVELAILKVLKPTWYEAIKRHKNSKKSSSISKK